jgi:hypothetical protein
MASDGQVEFDMLDARFSQPAGVYAILFLVLIEEKREAPASL